jgi:transketolase
VAADLGFSKIKEAIPNQFIDVGIAEANMISVAAGLAYSGKVVFTNTIATFATLRVCEQVRTGCCYPNLNVKMFGMGRGLSYGFLGCTHLAIEDLGVFRSMANMTIVVPADARDAENMIGAVVEYPGPVYMGLSRGDVPVVNSECYDFQIGKAVTLREGGDVSIIAIGPMIARALDAADILAKKGIQARVINMHTIKPLDEQAVIKAAEETGGIVTVEDHNIIGGLGGAVAEVVVEKCPVPMKRVGIPDVYCAVGHFEELLDKYKLNSPDIVEAAKSVIGRK